MARRNKRGLKLTWCKHTNRWRKMIKGKVYYWPAKGKSDTESYKAACKEADEILAKFALGDGIKRYQRNRLKADAIIANAQGNEFSDGKGYMEQIQAQHDAQAFLPVKELASLYDAKHGEGAFKAMEQRKVLEKFNLLMIEAEYYKKTYPDIAFPGITNKSQAGIVTYTVTQILDIFLESLEKRHNDSQLIEKMKEEGMEIEETSRERLSTGRYNRIAGVVKKMKEFAGNRAWDKSEDCATSLLNDWQIKCKALLKDKIFSIHEYNERMKVAKQFINFSHSEKYLENVPRKIDKFCAKYNYKSNAKSIPIETVQTLWNNADNDFERMIISLGLNAGFYAVDISDLMKAEIKEGYIVRERGKTGVPATHKLWAITQDLICKASSGENRFFVDKNGKPLVHYKGNYRVDAVASAWGKLCRRAGVTGFTFSNLRDTATTLVYSKFPTMKDKFLSHVDNSESNRYIDAKTGIDKSLDEVIGFLEKEFDLK